MANKSVERMSTRIKVIVAVSAASEIALVGVAHADISRRKASQIRGPKSMWRAITLITFVGPLWYFWRGRR